VVTDQGAPAGQKEIIFVSGIASTLGEPMIGTQSTSFLFTGPIPTFEQLDFESGGELFGNSDVGRAVLEYEPVLFSEFLNVIARIPGNPQGAWVVRNMYLPDAASAPPLENLSARFPLSECGLAPGTPLTDLEYDFRITPGVMHDVDAAAWLASAVWRSPAPVDHQAVVAEGHEGATGPTVTPDPDSLA